MSDELERLRAVLAVEADISNELRAELAAERTRADVACRQYVAALADRAKLREALEMSREAISDAREFTATALAKIGDGHRIGELVADWDYATKRIDAVLEETGGRGWTS